MNVALRVEINVEISVGSYITESLMDDILE